MIQDEKQILEAWSRNTKSEIVAMFPQYSYYQIANFVSRHNRQVRKGIKHGNIYLKKAEIKTQANAIFTPEELEKLYELYPTGTKKQLLEAFPGRTAEQIRDHIATRNKRIRQGSIKGKIILKLDTTQVKTAAKEAEEGWQEYDIPLKGIITENMYAYRLGYELRAETYHSSRTGGKGIFETQRLQKVA